MNNYHLYEEIGRGKYSQVSWREGLLEGWAVEAASLFYCYTNAYTSHRWHKISMSSLHLSLHHFVYLLVVNLDLSKTGHGKHLWAQVYKGRKKFTIQFVAVKSIEKCRREKVMTEVELLSGLHHANLVMWYWETAEWSEPLGSFFLGGVD